MPDSDATATAVSSEDLAAVARVDLFEGLPDKVFERLRVDGQRHSYGPGDAVTREGDEVGGLRPFSREGTLFHVVLGGSGEVSRGGRVLGRVGPGDYFGELSLIDGGPRTADVVAGPDGMTTFALTKWTFNDLLLAQPEVAVPMLRVLAGRLRRCEAARDA